MNKRMEYGSFFKYWAETPANSIIKMAEKKAMYFVGTYNNARTPHMTPQNTSCLQLYLRPKSCENNMPTQNTKACPNTM